MGRDYDKERDRKAVQRIWIESGWIEDDEKQLEAFDIFLESSRVRVTDLEGEAESMVTTAPGAYRHGTEDIPFSVVSSVNTGRIGRKRGLAGRLLAESLARDVEAGAAAAGLGIFEQGYYDRLGFGTTVYERLIAFDPATLIDFGIRDQPSRIGTEDYAAVHSSRLSRMRRHGSVNLHSEGHTRADMLFEKKSFGLGFRNGDDIEAMLWINPKNVESGPYSIWWYTFREWNDIARVFSLIKSLEEQVQSVTMREPCYLQMQDFLTKPLRTQAMSRGSTHTQQNRAVAFHQIRICDLERAVAAVSVPHEDIAFNLTVHDPIEAFLPEKSVWRGCSGTYTVTFGEVSHCRPGHSPGLPLMEADIGSFTRLWCGALPAPALAVAGGVTAPASVLERLDAALRFPPPSPDWEY